MSEEEFEKVWKEWSWDMYEYWGSQNWSGTDQLLYDMAYNTYRVTGS